MSRYLYHMVFEPTSAWEQAKASLWVAGVAGVVYLIMAVFMRKEK